MTNEKGITMIALVVTIMVMIILTAAVINFGGESYKSVEFQSFNYELEQVQGKVDVIYEKIKLGETNYITLGNDITDSSKAVETLKIVTGIDYENIPAVDVDKFYYNGEYTTYRYFTEDEIREQFDISSTPGSMIINFLTRDVISVNGFKVDDNSTVYTK